MTLGPMQSTNSQDMHSLGSAIELVPLCKHSSLRGLYNAMPAIPVPGKMVFLIVSPLSDGKLVGWSGSKGRRTALCHCAVLVCEDGITRRHLLEIFHEGDSLSKSLRLGLLFELRRVNTTEYELVNMPGFTTKDLALEFPECSVFFVGPTQKQDSDIIGIGDRIRDDHPHYRLFTYNCQNWAIDLVREITGADIPVRAISDIIRYKR